VFKNKTEKDDRDGFPGRVFFKDYSEKEMHDFSWASLVVLFLSGVVLSLSFVIDFYFEKKVSLCVFFEFVGAIISFCLSIVFCLKLKK
jgi:hypothetical protein